MSQQKIKQISFIVYWKRFFK